MGLFEDYFLNPILQNGWFNPVNTVAYSLILVGAVFLVFKLLSRMKIPIDRRFFYAVLPFIFWGSSTRVLHDAAFAGRLSPGLNAFYSSPLFPTPGSYFITFTLAIIVLLISLGIQRWGKIPYWKPMAGIGTVLVLVNLALLPSANPLRLLQVAGLAVLLSGAVFLVSRFFKKSPTLTRVLSLPNQAILGAHFLDASATFVSLTFYGYVEQHVLPRLLFPAFGPVSLIPLKILVVLPVLWAIDRYGGEDRNFRNFLKIVVFILGAAPGLRDLLRLMAGV